MAILDQYQMAAIYRYINAIHLIKLSLRGDNLLPTFVNLRPTFVNLQTYFWHKKVSLYNYISTLICYNIGIICTINCTLSMCTGIVPYKERISPKPAPPLHLALPIACVYSL